MGFMCVFLLSWTVGLCRLLNSAYRWIKSDISYPTVSLQMNCLNKNASVSESPGVLLLNQDLKEAVFFKKTFKIVLS